jgi:hypothetical protein
LLVFIHEIDTKDSILLEKLQWFFNGTNSFLGEKDTYELSDSDISLIKRIAKTFSKIKENRNKLPDNLRDTTTIAQIEFLHSTAGDFLLQYQARAKEGATPLFSKLKEAVKRFAPLVKTISTAIAIISTGYAPSHNALNRIDRHDFVQNEKLKELDDKVTGIMKCR